MLKPIGTRLGQEVRKIINLFKSKKYTLIHYHKIKNR
jgi:hypothetical protein